MLIKKPLYKHFLHLTPTPLEKVDLEFILSMPIKRHSKKSEVGHGIYWYKKLKETSWKKVEYVDGDNVYWNYDPLDWTGYKKGWLSKKDLFGKLL
jgi:hypothetical protein